MKQTYLYPVLLSLLLLPGLTHLQLHTQLTPKSDSLKLELAQVTDSKQKADILLSLSELYRENTPGTSMVYAKQAYDLSLEVDYPKGQVKALVKMGAIQARKSDYVKALDYAMKADSIAKKHKLEAERISTNKLAGAIFTVIGDYDRASSYLFEGLKIAEWLDDKKSISSLLSSIGVAYDYQQNYEKAYGYYDRALEISREINDKKGIARELNNLANAAWYMGETETYEKNMRQAIELNKESNQQYWLFMNYYNLGELFFLNGQFDSAKIYNQYAYTIAEELGDLKAMSAIMTTMAEHQLKIYGDTISALRLATEAFTLGQKIKTQKEMYAAASFLSDLYEKTLNIDSAYKYANLKFQSKDSLEIGKANAMLSRLELQYKLDKQASDLERQKQRSDLMLLLIIGSLMAGSAILAFYYYRNRVKTKMAFLDKQHEADRKIRQSEKKFRDVFNSIEDVFSRSDMEGKCLMISPSIYNLLGYHPEEMIGRNMADFYANPKERFEIIQRLKQSQKVENFEFEAVKKNGDIIIASATAKIYYDEEGKPLGVEGVIRDVTEKHEAEKALRESEEKFRGVFNNMIDVFARADLEGNCLLISPSVYNILGYQPEEIIGRNYKDFFARPEDWEALNQQMIEKGEMKDIESELVRKDGNHIFISSNAVVFYDELGDPSGIESVFRDVTEQKRAESEHNKLFNVSFDLLCIAGFDGYFKELNPAWEQATGYSIKELKTRPFIEYIHEDDRENTNAEVAKLFKGSITHDFENRYRTKDGRIIDLSWTATPLQDEELMYCIARDITARKENERQIVFYQRRLKNLASEITLAEERVRKQIAVDLHDHVGQLLTSIRMQLARVNDLTENPEAVVRIRNISQSVLKAVQATREAIFSLSLPQLNELGLIAATYDWMKQEIESKYDIQTILTGEETRFNIDDNTRILMFRSLRELMMNVVKHARAKNLKIAFKTVNGNLDVLVEDDGIGFNYNAEIVRLKGSGYGLFSIEERLTDLGGSMMVDTYPGNGTRITISIPLS